MSGFIQVIINGVLIGGVYSLIAVGLNLIFGVMGIINFAHCDFLMLGMYFTYSLSTLFINMMSGAAVYGLIIPVAIIMFIIGVVFYITMIKPLIGRDIVSYVLLTVGLSYVIQNIAQIFWTASPVSINTTIKSQSIYLESVDLVFPLAKLIAFCIALVIVFAISYLLNKTDLGRAIRATSESTEVASYLGVNPGRSYLIAFGLGIMFAGIAGILLSPVYSIYPRIGTTFATTIFAIVVIGGLGQIKGAMLAGLLVGIVENIVGSYFALDLAPIAVFTLFILVMLLKPAGLFGSQTRKA